MRAVQTLPVVPMKRYGENPYGDSLYRVVFSDSRTDLLGGKWPDGECAYREVPRYPGIRSQWILEKWCAPAEYAGTPEQYTREQWDADSGLLTCGPYPNRGEYAHCYTFPFMPTDGMICQIVGALKVSRDITSSDRKQGILEPLERQQREQETRFEDIFKDAMGPWSGDSATVAMNPAVRFKKPGDMPMPRFDQESPLPTKDNIFGTIQNKQTIESLTGD
jgi:hypothetical protein